MTSTTTMRRPRCTHLLLATLLLLPAWAAAQTADTPRATQSRDRVPAPAAVAPRSVDADWILHRLTRGAADATPFAELRVSSMLKRPLLLSGEYRRPDVDTLVREVRVPYVETTTIRGGEATIAREGRSPRTFSLSRAPELAALQGSFGALLAGDRTALEAVYALEADGVPADWTLTLTPREPRLAARVTAIVLRGRDAELRCIETRQKQGDAQPTLLGSAATAAATVDSLEAAQRLCHDVPR